jgi:hypothetical protein
VTPDLSATERWILEELAGPDKLAPCPLRSPALVRRIGDRVWSCSAVGAERAPVPRPLSPVVAEMDVAFQMEGDSVRVAPTMRT